MALFHPMVHSRFVLFSFATNPIEKARDEKWTSRNRDGERREQEQNVE